MTAIGLVLVLAGLVGLALLLGAAPIGFHPAALIALFTLVVLVAFPGDHRR